MDAIAHQIVQARKNLGLSQQEFTTLFNRSHPIKVQLSRSSLAKYETGRAMPPADKYFKILQISILYPR